MSYWKCIKLSPLGRPASYTPGKVYLMTNKGLMDDNGYYREIIRESLLHLEGGGDFHRQFFKKVNFKDYSKLL